MPAALTTVIPGCMWPGDCQHHYIRDDVARVAGADRGQCAAARRPLSGAEQSGPLEFHQRRVALAVAASTDRLDGNDQLVPGLSQEMAQLAGPCLLWRPGAAQPGLGPVHMELSMS